MSKRESQTPLRCPHCGYLVVEDVVSTCPLCKESLATVLGDNQKHSTLKQAGSQIGYLSMLGASFSSRSRNVEAPQNEQ